MTAQASTTATNNWARKIGLTAIAGAAFMGAASAPAAAESFIIIGDPVPKYASGDRSFRAAHPLRVYVKLADSRRDRGTPGYRKDRRHGRPSQYQSSYQALHQLGYHLPDYVRMVDNPEYADLVIRVRETDYNLNFRVIDVDHKDKKYKKSRRYTGGRCGVYHKAYYTKIKEKGEAYASYNIKVNLKGVGRDQDRFTLRSAENFSYGRDLRARTNCGTQPTHHMPSNGVAELFSKSNDGYRRHVTQEIREEAARDLSRQLAHRIRVQADYFYDDLAARLAYGSHRYRSDEHGAYEGGFTFGFYKERPRTSGGYGR